MAKVRVLLVWALAMAGWIVLRIMCELHIFFTSHAEVNVLEPCRVSL
jgi:hypothetical protein